MTRISLLSVVYCSLETPARSAAPYAHQWHTKPKILGLNLSPVLIRSQLLFWILDAGFWMLEGQENVSSLSSIKYQAFSI
jgi:hypothetical protein